VEEYLLTRDPSVYIDNASAEHRFSWIRTNLKVLVHHFGMDFRPYEIPQKNVDSARFVLNSIDPEYRSLPEYHYEKGWLCFLEGDYKQAIAEMEKVLADSSRVPEDQKWQILSLAYRNMGFCYDMTGNRSDAIAMYNQGKETSGRYGSLPGKYIYALFDRWIEEPYKHQESED
jgi:tetratricopeptide (TPR) repeat protein